MSETKRQFFPAGLWVVATPIGNLADLTPRAKMAIEQADFLLCEDTRRTATLLSAIGIQRSGHVLERMDAHTPRQKISGWVERLREGKSLALMTDAGTPGISDPGAALVSEARKAGVRITPVPGVSAVTALLSISGFQDTAFVFRGFFPRKAEDRKQELDLITHSKISQICVWYESPQRVTESLLLISEHCPEVEMVVGKELTKIHEKLFYGNALQVSEEVAKEIATEGAVGEWCFSIHFTCQTEEFSNELWEKTLICLLEVGISPSDAAKKVSQHFGVPKNTAYQKSLSLSGKKAK
jgi:16S rRNA (cytidine1402-2'-O)-methyltransferase